MEPSNAFISETKGMNNIAILLAVAFGLIWIITIPTEGDYTDCDINPKANHIVLRTSVGIIYGINIYL